MFKAKLIANPSFVFFKKHSQILFLFVILVNSMIINILLFDKMDSLLLIFTIPIACAVQVRIYKVNKRIVSSIQDRQIEADFEYLRIKNKSGQVDFEIPLSGIESIRLQKEYKYEDSFIKELSKQLRGQSNYHFIQIYFNGQWMTMRFMLESIYMETKLNELVRHWMTLGIPVEYSNEPLSSSDRRQILEAVK